MLPKKYPSLEVTTEVSEKKPDEEVFPNVILSLYANTRLRLKLFVPKGKPSKKRYCQRR